MVTARHSIALLAVMVLVSTAAANQQNQTQSADEVQQQQQQQECSYAIEPVCATATNVTYGNRCFAESQGVQQLEDGVCPDDVSTGIWDEEGRDARFWVGSGGGAVSRATMLAFAKEGFHYIARANLQVSGVRVGAPSVGGGADSDAAGGGAASYRPGVMNAVRVTADGFVYEQVGRGAYEAALRAAARNMSTPAFVPTAPAGAGTAATPGQQADAGAATIANSKGGRRLRWVLGETDQRAPLTPAQQAKFPFKATGQLLIRDEEGNSYSCSGALVGPSAVLTAAHCVYDAAAGRYFKDITFTPDLNAPETPVQPVAWVHATTYREYRDTRDVNYDLAVLELAQPIGQRLGYLGYTYKCGSLDMKLTSMGYPSDKAFGAAYTQKCSVAPKFDVCTGNGTTKWNPSTQPLQRHYCDSATGQSGAPMWDANNRIRAVLVAESETCKGPDGCENFGLLINEYHYSFIKQHAGGAGDGSKATPPASAQEEKQPAPVQQQQQQQAKTAPQQAKAKGGVVQG